MADPLSLLFTFFGTIGLVGIKFFLGKLFKGGIGLIIQAGIGIGAAVVASFVVIFCPPLATVMVIGAVVLGGLPGTLMLYLGPSIPFVGESIGIAVDPISGILFTLLILTAAEFVLKILSIFIIVPWFAIVIIFLNVALPVIMLYLVWSSFTGAFADLPACIGLGEGPSAAIPGTGGVRIGT